MPLIKSAKPSAVGKNIKTEMKHGKPHKQSIAIALSVQRAAKKKKMADGGEVRAASFKPDADEKEKRSMEMLDGHPHEHQEELDARKEHMSDIDHAADPMEMEMMEHHSPQHKAELDLREEHETDIDHASDPMEMDMLDAHPTKHHEEKRAGSEPHHDIDERDAMELDMIKRLARGGIVNAIRRKHSRMADGGEVDLQNNADEHLNLEDQLSYQAARKHTYFDDSQIHEQPHDSNLHGDEREHERSDQHDMVDAIRKKMKPKR